MTLPLSSLLTAFHVLPGEAKSGSEWIVKLETLAVPLISWASILTDNPSRKGTYLITTLGDAFNTTWHRDDWLWSCIQVRSRLELMFSNCGAGEDFESPLDCKEIRLVNPKGDQP